MTNQLLLMQHSLEMAAQRTQQQNMSANFGMPQGSGTDAAENFFKILGLGASTSSSGNYQTMLDDYLSIFSFPPMPLFFDDFEIDDYKSNKGSFTYKNRLGLKVSPKEAVKWARSQIGTVGGMKYCGRDDLKYCIGFLKCAYGGIFNTLSSSRLKKWAKDKNIYNQGTDISGIQEGDLVLWQPDTNTKRKNGTGISHGAIITGINRKKGIVKITHGNSYGRDVAERTYKIADNKLYEVRNGNLRDAQIDGFISMETVASKDTNTDTNKNSYDAIA